MVKEFEPTEESHIVRLIRENTAQPELGRVTKVFEHDDPNDFSNFEANVRLRDAEKERRRVPIATVPFLGGVAVPEPGDTVLVDFLDGDAESPVVVGMVHNDVDRAPLGQAGIYRLRKGDLYFEMHPDGEWMRLAQKDADDGEPTSRVEITQNGEVNITGHKEQATDHATTSGDGASTVFTLGHSLGQVPSTVNVQPTSADAAEHNFYVSDKTDSTVEITYLSAPADGTDNLTFDITTTE